MICPFANRAIQMTMTPARSRLSPERFSTPRRTWEQALQPRHFFLNLFASTTARTTGGFTLLKTGSESGDGNPNRSSIRLGMNSSHANLSCKQDWVAGSSEQSISITLRQGWGRVGTRLHGRGSATHAVSKLAHSIPVLGDLLIRYHAWSVSGARRNPETQSNLQNHGPLWHSFIVPAGRAETRLEKARMRPAGRAEHPLPRPSLRVGAGPLCGIGKALNADPLCGPGYDFTEGLPKT
jgi:hypothetical protein